MKRFRFILLWSNLVRTYFRVIRPRILSWGLVSDTDNADHHYHGDDLISSANLIATRTITINASPEEIWKWLAQMGRQRTGFYGIDRLDNWNIPSLRYIREDIEPLDHGMLLDNGLQVFDFKENRYLLIGGFHMPNDFDSKCDCSYLYQLETISEAETRLIIRMRCNSEGIKGWLYNRFFEVIDTVATIAQLKGIKERAEAETTPEFISIPLSEVDVIPSEFETQ